jgi:exonuclease III
LREGHLRMIPFKLWREAEFLIAPALDGAIAASNPAASSGRGGLLMAIGPRLRPCILNKGMLPSKRGLWFTFDHPTLGIFGILSVYAPTGTDSRRERTELWNEIFHVIPNHLAWILVGDLNMIDQILDQQGGIPHTVLGREKRAWSHLLGRFNLRDTFDASTSQLRFLWDNRREADANHSSPRILRRIDRAYAPKQSRLLRMDIKSKILAGERGSDHYPILLWGQEVQKQKVSSRYQMKVSVLDSAEKELMQSSA